MTTRHLEYTLDRLLSRETTIPGPDVTDPTFRFTTKVTGVTNLQAAGQWFLDVINLYIFHEDADAVALPMGGSLTLDASSIVLITAGAYSLATTLVAYGVGANPFGQPLPDTRRFELGDAPAIPSHDFTITIPTGAEPTTIIGTKKVWCMRRDFTGRDQINIGDSTYFTLEDTRIIVRDDGTWANMDTFMLEGVNYTVRGIAKVGGRGQYLELLARGT